MSISHILSSRPVSHWVWSALAAIAALWIAGLFFLHGNREASIEQAFNAGQRITLDLATGEISGNLHKAGAKPAAKQEPEQQSHAEKAAEPDKPAAPAGEPAQEPAPPEPLMQEPEAPEPEAQRPAEPEPVKEELLPVAATPTDTPVLEKTPEGVLPTTAADGTVSWQYFAQPGTEVPAGKPTITIIIAGLGLSATTTRDALDLPPAVTLSFSPYANGAPAAADKARAKGHEIMIDLPVEPVDFPTSDPGPNGLISSLSEKENTARLYKTLSRFPGYVGVFAGGLSRLAIAPESFGSLLQNITRRGLLFVHAAPEAQALEAHLNAQATPALSAHVIADAQPSAESLEDALARAESVARAHGHALIIGHAYPLTLRRMASWIASLKEKGFAVVPATQLLRMQMAEAAAAQKPPAKAAE